MIAKETRLSIIIVNYNTKALTNQCVESIVKYTQCVEYEIILVDNGSSDGSQEFFSKDTRLLFIASKENLGFGKANNLGFKHSSGKYILLLNSDTMLYRDVLSEMVLFLEEHKEIGCLGTILRDENNNIVHSYGRFPHWYDEFVCDKKKNYDYLNSYPSCVEMITGADLMIRRDVVDCYGLFDSDFFMYYEDSEMMFRYNKKGVVSAVIDAPGIIHLEGASSKISFRKAIMQSQGFYIYISKIYNPLFAFFAKLIITLKRFLTIWMKPWNLREKFYYICRLFSWIIK